MLLEVNEAYGVNIVGAFDGAVRDDAQGLVLVAEEIDKPDWIP